MFFGVLLFLSPLGALADVLPILGSIARGGTFLVALAVSIPLSLLVIALAWLFYRPLLAIALIALGIAVVAGIVVLVRRLSPSRQAAGLETATPAD